MQPGIELPSERSIPEYDKDPKWNTIITEAVAVAISSQQYDLALEWLEQGLSVLWGQTLQLPTPYDDLYVGNATILVQLQQVLYHRPKHQETPKPTGGAPAHNRSPLDHSASDLYRPGRQKTTDAREYRLSELFNLVRLLPRRGEYTLCPPKAANLMNLVRDGVAVILNLARDRCDALVIQAGAQEVTHVPLTHFSIQKAEEVEAILRSLRILTLGRDPIAWGGRASECKQALAILWYDVVKPVLDHLGIVQCTTGLLSSLPLHAAGDYDKYSAALPDLAISSNTPTLSFLNRRTSTPGTFSGILAVEGSGRTFSGAKAVLDQLQAQANCLPFTRLDGENACTDTVLEAMENYSWVHLACCGPQNRLDPMQSVLRLHDGNLDLATITRNPIKNAQFAFLSPSPGDVGGDFEGPDKHAPLTVGLLAIGYMGVIVATGDDYGTLLAVSREVYECLLEGGVPDSRKAAKALHKAVATVRRTVGVENFDRWIHYVHIGC
ncbi:hypothetical protein FS749_006194 [Ceratobasidium sp. UAMH 11750]|nr:hypothetical protein FS749_006194 [Ceratobasidium sp. UAMH 11750]